MTLFLLRLLIFVRLEVLLSGVGLRKLDELVQRCRQLIHRGLALLPVLFDRLIEVVADSLELGILLSPILFQTLAHFQLLISQAFCDRLGDQGFYILVGGSLSG